MNTTVRLKIDKGALPLVQRPEISEILQGIVRQCEQFLAIHALPPAFSLQVGVKPLPQAKLDSGSRDIQLLSSDFGSLSQDEEQRLSDFFAELRRWSNTLDDAVHVTPLEISLIVSRNKDKPMQPDAASPTIGTNNAPQSSGDERKGSAPKLQFQDGLPTFLAVEPKYRLEQMVLPAELRADIMTSLELLRNQKLIYKDWGFEEIDPVMRATLNFYGPPGTGKTMAAHAIAHELGYKIIVADFAAIESKYVGESPKNLSNLFAVARQENALLFFDEADSFLGKRISSVTTSSDQATNSLRSHLLQLLENHSGIVIFCTNLVKNYDKAFESRILRSLHFPLPDEEARMQIIEKMIPSKVPFPENIRPTTEEIREIAKIADGFSGREIKNAILQTLCTIAAEKRAIVTVQDFKDAFTKRHEELEKLHEAQGIITGKRKEELEAKIKDGLADKEKTGTVTLEDNRPESEKEEPVAEPLKTPNGDHTENAKPQGATQ